MDRWLPGASTPDGPAFGVWLVVCLVLLLLTLPPWILVISLWRNNRALNAYLRVREKGHTNDLLTQSERFGQQYYNQGERSSLVLSDSLRRVMDSFAKAVNGMPDD